MATNLSFNSSICPRYIFRARHDSSILFSLPSIRVLAVVSLLSIISIFNSLKKAFHKILTNPEVSNGKKKSINIFIHAVSCFSATFINTLLFTSLLLLCFYNIIEEKAAEAGAQVMIFVFVNFVGINWILETIVNLLAGTVITSSLENLVNRKFNLLKQ